MALISWFRRALPDRKRVPQKPRRSSHSRCRLHVEQLEDRLVPAALLGTDLLDYAPGSTAFISGSGFQAGETIQIEIVHADTGVDAVGSNPYQITDGGAGDLDQKVDGNFTAAWFVDPVDSIGATLVATATGLSSGETATTIFTDSPNALTGHFYTTDVSGTVDANIYSSKDDVYLNGGPVNDNAGSGLPDGSYYVKVTAPDGTVLGKSTTAVVHVTDGKFDELYQLSAIVKTASSGYTDAGYDSTANPGDEYKVWISPTADFHLQKTDNFKIKVDTPPEEVPPPPPPVFVAPTISGIKFEDHNGNGIQDAGDQGLQGWHILVNGVDTGVVTDSTGAYSFQADAPGTYSIQELLVNGWTQTYGNAGYSVTVSAIGEVTDGTASGNDFGNFKNFDISGHKFQDHNGNGFAAGFNLTTLGGFLVYLDGTGSGTANGTFDYTDANSNGIFDTGDTALESYRITAADGSYCFSNLGPGSYSVQESTANQPDPGSWVQTGGNGGYTVVGSSGVSVSDQVTIVNGKVTAITSSVGAFANVHLGQQNGLTIGFWSNKNGAKIIDANNDGKLDASIFAGLKDLNLRNADGTFLIKATDTSLSTATFQKWLTSANANNMANMLSAQLAATWLNVNTGKVSATSYIDINKVTIVGSGAPLSQTFINSLHAHGIDTDLNGFDQVSAFIYAAKLELATANLTIGASADRTYEEALKNIFDAINNNESIFVL